MNKMTIHCNKCGNRVERIRADCKTMNYAIYIQIRNYEQMTNKKSEESDNFIICKDCAREIFSNISKRPTSNLNLDYRNMSEYDR